MKDPAVLKVPLQVPFVLKLLCARIVHAAMTCYRSSRKVKPPSSVRVLGLGPLLPPLPEGRLPPAGTGCGQRQVACPRGAQRAKINFYS